MAAEDGTRIIACTPHILPGVYDNQGPDILSAVLDLQGELDKEGVPLVLTSGADVHIAPGLVDEVRSRRVLPLGQSRYLLLEPPQTLVPPRFEDQLFDLLRAGLVPIITHPERLAWPERDYGIFERIVRMGCLMQLTAGSLLGHFGRHVKILSERMIDDGLIHVLASDAHNTDRRSPILSPAFEAAASRIGREYAFHLVSTRPASILKDRDPSRLPAPARVGVSERGRLGRLA